MSVGARVVHVSRHDLVVRVEAGGVSGSEGARARFRVPRGETTA